VSAAPRSPGHGIARPKSSSDAGRVIRHGHHPQTGAPTPRPNNRS
jgi:hypothetical protein